MIQMRLHTDAMAATPRTAKQELGRPNYDAHERHRSRAEGVQARSISA